MRCLSILVVATVLLDFSCSCVAIGTHLRRVYRRLRGDVIDKDCSGIPRGGWQKDSRYMERLRGGGGGGGGLLKYIINYALHLAHYDAYFHMNNDAKKC